jgi:prevent-host-death family protein
MIISKSLLKSKMLELFRNVENTGEEIIVTDNGKPVLKVVPIWDSKSWAEVFPEGAGKIVCTKEELIKADESLWENYTG